MCASPAGELCLSHVPDPTIASPLPVPSICVFQAQDCFCVGHIQKESTRLLTPAFTRFWTAMQFAGAAARIRQIPVYLVPIEIRVSLNAHAMTQQQELCSVVDCPKYPAITAMLGRVTNPSSTVPPERYAGIFRLAGGFTPSHFNREAIEYNGCFQDLGAAVRVAQIFAMFHQIPLHPIPLTTEERLFRIAPIGDQWCVLEVTAEGVVPNSAWVCPTREAARDLGQRIATTYNGELIMSGPSMT